MALLLGALVTLPWPVVSLLTAPAAWVVLLVLLGAGVGAVLVRSGRFVSVVLVTASAIVEVLVCWACASVLSAAEVLRGEFCAATVLMKAAKVSV